MNKTGLERLEKGIKILEDSGIEEVDYSHFGYKDWTVRGNEQLYRVSLYSDGRWECGCPDHQERDVICKHIYAVIGFLYRGLDIIRQPTFTAFEITPNEIFKTDNNLTYEDLTKNINAIKDLIDNNAKKEELIEIFLKLALEVSKVRI